MSTVTGFNDDSNEFRELRESIRPIIQASLHLQEEFSKIAQSMPVIDMLRISSEISRVSRIFDFAKFQASLAASIQPLPDFSSIFRSQVEINSIAQSFSQINAQIAAARLIGDITIHQTEAEEEIGDQVIEEQAEEQLIEVVPADALNALKEVNFAPVVLLDRALRNPELMMKFNSRQFEEFTAELIQRLGFENVVLTPPSGDGGRDVLASKCVHGIQVFFAFECKRYAPDRPVGPEFARALFGTIMHEGTRATKGILVTTSFFSPSARQYILTEPNLDSRDFDGIVDWLEEYRARGTT